MRLRLMTEAVACFTACVFLSLIGCGGPAAEDVTAQRDQAEPAGASAPVVASVAAFAMPPDVGAGQATASAGGESLSPTAADNDAVAADVSATTDARADRSAGETGSAGEAAAAQPAGQPAPAAAALATVFSPSRAPEQKTMGLMQRSFLDIAEQGNGPLQLAIVVDGSDSMAAELSGVRDSINQMIDDLQRYRGNRVEVALVIYRDSGSPSGEVTLPLKTFTRDREATLEAIERLVPESGAPFFHELVDVGIHTALDQLDWSADPQTARWIMLFGDAPPYEESFSDPQFPAARRRYATELLVALAVRKSIRINSVLCTSNAATVAPYGSTLDQTRRFMAALAAGTDGLMLDLSYPDIRTALIESSQSPTLRYVAVAPITREDLAAARQRLGTDTADADGASDPDVRIAVVPHLPLQRMSFDPSQPAVQVSTALRHNFSRLPGVRVVSPIDIQKQLRRLRSDSVSDDQRMRALAARLGVDYVIWGSVEPSGPTVQSAAYRRSDGSQVVQVSLRGNEQPLTRVILTAAATAPLEKGGALGGLLQRIEKSVSAKSIETPLAKTTATEKEILTAIEALDQALGLAAGSEESDELLDRAAASVQLAAATEPRNPLVHWLDANICYNRAMRAFSIGDALRASEQMKQMGTALARAYRGRRELSDAALATEIDADYTLMVQRDAAAAIAGYEKLTDPANPSASRLRGHWMLAGIYAGDWGVAPELVDPTAAREHLVAILGGWEQSPEAALLRKWMRWDDAAGMTKYSYLPIVNDELAVALPSEEEADPGDSPAAGSDPSVDPEQAGERDVQPTPAADAQSTPTANAQPDPLPANPAQPDLER